MAQLQSTVVSGNTSTTGFISAGGRKLSMGILDLRSDGTPTQFKIKTTIPWNSGGADFTVNIKGFRYGGPQMVSLSIGWHHYLNTFHNEKAISNGAWAPTITLAKSSDNYVVIHLAGPGYWPKLYVESLYSSSYTDSYASGWTWSDADLSDCTDVSVVPYDALACSITGNSVTTSQTNFSTLTLNSATVATQSWVQSQGYITGESDTLASVTGRGATTSTAVTFNGNVNANGTYFNVGGYIDLSGLLYLRSNVNYLNASSNGWNTFLARNGEGFDAYVSRVFSSSHISSTGGNIHTARGRVAFSSTSTDANHTIYNNYNNIDGEGSWDGMKMNVYNGLDVRTGNASGAAPSTVLQVRPGGLIITGTLAWNNATPMVNVGGSGDGRMQVRHIWGKEAGTANPDHLWLQYTNSSFGVQIGASGGTNPLYVAGDIYMNGYFSGSLVATRTWVQSQGYITGYTESDTLATVTARGATTGTATVFTNSLFARKSQTAGNYTTAALWTESYDNTTTGIAFHISGNVGKFLEMRTNGVLYWHGDTVWHSGNLTNLNQLTNGPGYVTGGPYLPLSGGTLSGQLTITGARLLVETGGSNTYGIVSGYNNNNHLMTMRAGVSGSTSSPTFTAGHKMTFVEYAEANDSTGWYFISSQPGTYTEVARITRTGINWNGNTVYHSGNLTNLNQLTNGPGYITSESDTLATVTGRGASTSVQMLQNGGRFVRDSHYRTISGVSDYYGGGSAGWYKVAQITLTGNCSGAVLFGTLNDNRYDGADAYQISVVARAECDFTSNNESHYINVGCSILGSTNYTNYRDKVRVLLVASSSGSRTYELQFYETPWNNDTWELQTTGWTIYSSPQAPGSSTGTARVNYISKQNSDYYYSNIAMYVNNNTVWHAGNDGSGSGLDADLLDGLNSSTSSTANTIVARDSGGDIYGRYVFAVHFNASCPNNENPSIAAIWTNSGSDNYLRKSTPAHFTSQLGLATQSWVTSQGYITGSYLPLSGGTLSGNLNIQTGNNPAHFLLRGTNPEMYIDAGYGGGTARLLINRAGTGNQATLFFTTGATVTPGTAWNSTGNPIWSMGMTNSSQVNDFKIAYGDIYDGGSVAVRIDTNKIVYFTNTPYVGGDIMATQSWVTSQGYLTGGSFVQNILGDSGAFNLNVSGQQAFFRFSQGNWVNGPTSGNYSHVLSVNAASDNRTFQVYFGDVPGYLWWRPSQGSTGWQHSWERILTSYNYNSWAPTLTGGGASGTWGINISGTAARATRANGNFYIDDNYGNTIVGVYTSTRYQGVFAMGDSYKLPADGTSTGSLYGLAWSHPNAGGVASNLNTHGLLVMENGTFLAAISGSIRARDDMRAPVFYDSNDTAYYLNPAGGSRLRNLYVGDSGDDWSDPGGWGTQVRFSNGPHVKFVLHARSPGIEAGMYVHTPGSVYIGSYTSHDVSMMYAGNRKMQITNSYIYTDVYLEAAGSLRAPIFYDSNDTNYYVDPNSNSYLSRLHVADASSGVSMHVGVGSTHGVYTLDNARKYLVVSGDYYPHMALVARYANNTNHGAVFSFVGSEGGAFRQWNLGISNNNPFLFSIGYNRTTDPNPHYGIGDGWSGSDNDHARLSVDRDGNTKIRGMLYVNGTSGGISTGSAVIHAGNIGSQSVSYASSAGNADTVDGYHATFSGNANTIPVRNGSGYLEPNNWIQLNGIYGLYSPTNNAHLRPNDASYGSWLVTGSRNGWQGFEFNSGSAGNVTLMVHTDSNTSGFHNNSYGWQIRWANGTLYIGKNSYGGNEATVIDSSSIGSQSVNYASSSGTASNANALGGLGSGAYMKDDGWNSYPGQDANTQAGMCSDFSYSNNAPWTGDLIRFGSGGYSLQLSSQYQGTGLSFRSRNGDNGTWNSWSTVIHSNNIGSQKVDGAFKLWATSHPNDYYIVNNWTGSYWQLTSNHGSGVQVAYANDSGYASSAGNSSTVGGVAIGNIVRKDVTGQYLRAYYEYGSYLTSESPIDLVNQGLAGGGLRVDFMHPSYTGSGGWNHVMTWSGYNGYNMYQLGGHYDGGTGTNLWVRSEANHGRTSWTAWRRLLNTSSDPYAANMNQYVRTSDGVTFSGLTINGTTTLNGNVNIDRHIDADTTWGNCGCTSLFLGWSTGKIIIGNNGTGAHDWANDRGANSIVSTVNHFFYNNIYAREDIIAYWSDARLKDNVRPIEGALEKITKIGGYYYTPSKLAVDLNATSDMSERVGVMAQEIEEVLPHVVKPAPFNSDYKTVQYEKLVPLLIEAVKEQQIQIEDLKKQINNK